MHRDTGCSEDFVQQKRGVGDGRPLDPARIGKQKSMTVTLTK